MSYCFFIFAYESAAVDLSMFFPRIHHQITSGMFINLMVKTVIHFMVYDTYHL